MRGQTERDHAAARPDIQNFGFRISDFGFEELDELLCFRPRNQRAFVAKKRLPAKFHRAEQMLERLALPAAPDQFAQRRQLRFAKNALELEIKLDALALSVCASKCSAFRRGLSIPRFLK